MITIETTSKGAELISVKLNGAEKMHDGATFWNRHAPVLFPIVGKLKDNKTFIDGKEFNMGQHGFARDMEFETLGNNSYVLKSNKETLEKFPFKFELYISYEVKQNKVITKYKIINKDDKQMIFGLGGHPAFKCEYTTGEYRLEFEPKEDFEIYQLEEGLVKTKQEETSDFIKENKLFLDKNIFKNDAIIIKNIKSRKVYLKKENKNILCFEFEDFPYLGIWSKEDAPFVCIEPWFNTADYINSNNIFEEKEDLIELESNQEFKAQYSVEFFKQSNN